MKKSELLSLSIAVAGIAAALPQTAAAAECGTVTGASDVATCTITAGNYLQEDVAFAGSKGVHTEYDDNASYFAACSYHVQGKSSFGMTTNSSLMTTRAATGKTTDSLSGCAA